MSSIASRVGEKVPTFAQSLAFVKSATRSVNSNVTTVGHGVARAFESMRSSFVEFASKVESFATSLVTVKSDDVSLPLGKEWKRQSSREELFDRVKDKPQLIELRRDLSAEDVRAFSHWQQISVDAFS
ncbi:hypothetical protein DDE05_46270 [Streptomyces cavourensis]|nr:hypothetical protein DDE05_46270 [Streptomyces cavourensis]